MTWIQFLTNLLSLSVFSALIVGACIFFGKKYLSGYLEQKSKNLAQKEDIGVITSIVEEIKNEHVERIEEIRKTNQMLLNADSNTHNLKINIYSESIIAIDVIVNSLSSYPDDDDKYEIQMSNVEDAFNKITQVILVCSEEVLRTIFSIVETYNISRLEIEKFKDSLDREKKILKVKLDKVKSFSDNESKDMVISEIQNQISLKELEFIKLCRDRHIEMLKLLPKFVAGMRKELGLEISEETLSSIHASYLRKTNAHVEKYMGFK